MISANAAFPQAAELVLEPARSEGFDPPGAVPTEWKLPRHLVHTPAVYKQSDDPFPPATGNWNPDYQLPGIDGSVNAVVADDATIVAGGSFQHAGGAAARNLAVWDGASWTELGGGVNGTVFSLAAYSGLVYVGGRFTVAGSSSVSNIAMWDGSNWHDLGGGVGGAGENSAVYSLEIDDAGKLYAGGYFVEAGSATAFCVAMWDGGTWSDLDTGMGSAVYALELFNSILYAGGRFTTVGTSGISANRIAAYDGNWSSLGSGLDGDVYALQGYGAARLYVGGDFSTAGIHASNNLGYWRTSAGDWRPVTDGGTDGPVFDMEIVSDRLVVAGTFDEVGTLHSPGLAFYEGSGVWSAASGSSGIGEYQGAEGIFALCIAPAVHWGDDIIVNGGTFAWAGGLRVSNIAGYRLGNDTDGTWERLAGAVAHGADGPIRALAASGNRLYAGGYFSSIGQTDANGIAVRAGIHWSPLGEGIDGGAVLSLAPTTGGVYAGGTFYSAGGQPAGMVAYWDGSTWDDMNGGVSATFPATVNVTEATGDNVFVGGHFNHAGGVEVNSVAFWDGSSWSALGSGVSGGSVHAIAVASDDVYIGGSFTEVSGLNIAYLARWDGSDWHPVGGGVDGEVHALHLAGTDLFVGGAFAQVGGSISATNIARWSGASWSALGAGLTGSTVTALEGDASELFVGGSFSAAGGEALTNVAMWDGFDWLDMETGTDEAVSSIALHEYSIYTGGYFSEAGSVGSSYIGEWMLDAGLLPTELLMFSAFSGESGVVLRWTSASERNLADYTIEHRQKESFEFDRLHTTAAKGHEYGSTSYEHRIPDIASGRHVFRLRMEDFDGAVSFSKEIEIEVPQSSEVLFVSPYPNPASTSTRVRYRMVDGGEVRLEVRDILGRKMDVPLHRTRRDSGEEDVLLDVSALTPGLYFCRIESEKGRGMVRRFVVAR